MSPQNTKTYDPNQVLIDFGNSRQEPNEYQKSKIRKVLLDLDKALSDPLIGHFVWSYLSSFTPEGLRKDLIEDNDMSK